MADRPGIMLYFDDWVPMLSLDDSSLADLLRAAIQYGANGERPVFDGANAILWAMIASRIDRDAKAFNEKCRKARYNRYRGIEKDHGREPLDYEAWIEPVDECQPTSANVNQRDQHKHNTVSFHSHSHSQTQSQGDQRGERAAATPVQDFSTRFSTKEDDFEAKRNAALKKLEDIKL